MDIGKKRKVIEVEPVPVTEPVPEVAPEKEPVPAGVAA